ncbi:MAG: 23S rRNA (adenine(1618)-N(6))-methyltransferase RlmF [Glaciecola sp.]
MHKRNRHHQSYPIKALILAYPKLTPYVLYRSNQSPTIDFSNAQAVKALNTALLYYYYELEYWDIPQQYLCPPVPGRADYVHHIADLLALDNKGRIPKGNAVKGIDIGTGANMIYPIIAHRVYGWSMQGTDIDSGAIVNAKSILKANKHVLQHIDIKLQKNKNHVFSGIIGNDDQFHFCMCNPPFHASKSQAEAGSYRKQTNLSQNKAKRGSDVKATLNTTLNFAGKSNELWCKGGELKFVEGMIKESVTYGQNVGWFTSLISKKANLPSLQKVLASVNVSQSKTINMAQGQKASRFIAWTFQ